MVANYIYLKEDLCCSVCFEIFQDPTGLSCAKCLVEFTAKNIADVCPVRRRSSQFEPPYNLELKNPQMDVLESSQESVAASAELRCSNNEKPNLLGRDCQYLKCCLKPKTSADLKREVETALEALQEKLDNFRQVKQTCLKTTKHIKWQAKNTEREIKEDFAKLYRFLRTEEAARICALRREEIKKSQKMKEKLDELSNAVCCLSEDVRSIKQDLKAKDHLFLQTFKSCMKRAQCTMQIPQMDSGALIDVAKHLGNLKFKVWERMKNIVEYSPVILDPNTAHPELVVSDNLTSVTFNSIGPNYKDVGDNPERFDECACVLGSEGFISGRHVWDVDVRDSYLWEIGITPESNQRKGGNFYNGVWSVGSNVGFYSRCPLLPKSALSAEGGLRSIRIQLDCDKGQISFFDLINETDLETFTHTFTEKVYPFFWTRRINSPVTILPLAIMVSFDTKNEITKLQCLD